MEVRIRSRQATPIQIASTKLQNCDVNCSITVLLTYNYHKINMSRGLGDAAPVGT